MESWVRDMVLWRGVSLDAGAGFGQGRFRRSQWSPRGRRFWAGVAGAACLAASFVLANGYAKAATPCEAAQAAVKELYQYLEPGGEGPGWRKYLRDDQLEPQLAKGDDADYKTVVGVLGRYGTGAEGLQYAPFVKARRALVDWLTSLPAPPTDELPAAARAAKAAFLPPTDPDAEAAKTELLAALQRLDDRLKIGGEKGQGWAAYLKLDGAKHHLARAEKPDLAVLDAAYQRLAAGHDGLNLIWFADVRRALQSYLTTARLIGRADLRTQYQTVLEGLAGNLEEYRKSPSEETALAISATLEWLERAGQAKWLTRAVRQRLSHPNVLVKVSDDLVASRLAGPVEDTSPVQDYILGTDIRGTGHTTGQVSVELVPAQTAGQLDLVFKGKVDTDAVGYNGPVRIYSTGVAEIEGRKRLSLGAERIAGSPAASQAEVSTSINDIVSNKGRALVERLAWRRAMKQKAQAEYIAARHAEERFNERMDKQADELIAQANNDLQKKFRRPLLERRLFPELFRFQTTKDALYVTLLQAADGSLAAPGAPPEIPQSGDLSVKVHQSAITNLTNAALSGVILDEKRFRELAQEHLGPLAREKVPEENEDWSITFAPHQPISVTFDEGKFAITIRGQEYYADGETHPAMNVTAVYEIRKTERGFKALRQGKLSIFPPGFDPKSGEQLPPRIQMLRTMLERRFGKFLTEELTPKNLVVAAEGREPVQLQLTRLETTRGWLVLAWKKAAK